MRGSWESLFLFVSSSKFVIRYSLLRCFYSLPRIREAMQFRVRSTQFIYGMISVHRSHITSARGIWNYLENTNFWEICSRHIPKCPLLTTPANSDNVASSVIKEMTIRKSQEDVTVISIVQTVSHATPFRLRVPKHRIVNRKELHNSIWSCRMRS